MDKIIGQGIFGVVIAFFFLALLYKSDLEVIAKNKVHTGIFWKASWKIALFLISSLVILNFAPQTEYETIIFSTAFVSSAIVFFILALMSGMTNGGLTEVTAIIIFCISTLITSSYYLKITPIYQIIKHLIQVGTNLIQ